MNAQASKRRVLLVDDDPEILAALKQLIEVAVPSIRVFTTSNGPEALELLKRQEVELIISDYAMPAMDGIHFLKEAGRLRPNVVRLMITAFPDPAVAAKAVHDAGVALLITKPFDLEYFAGMITGLLAQNETRAQEAQREKKT